MRLLEVPIIDAQLDGTMPRSIVTHGPAGTGKTTIGRCIANELGATFMPYDSISIPDPELVCDDLCLEQNKRWVLFIDEAHTLRKGWQTALLIMSEQRIHPWTRQDLSHVTIVLATTELYLMAKPLLSRSQQALLRLYTPQELQRIVQRAAGMDKLTINPAAALEIGLASRGAARTALEHYTYVRSLARMQQPTAKRQGYASIKLSHVLEAMDRQNIHAFELGDYKTYLTKTQRDILVYLLGCPSWKAGIRRIANGVNMDARTIEKFEEPHLVQQQLVAGGGVRELMSRGRRIAEVITQR